MRYVNVNGVRLEYDMIGSGEPVLFISPVLADGFLPLWRHSELADHYQLIRYHKRGWGGSTHTPGPVTIKEHAAALLHDLGVPQDHVVGHSSGAAVAAQLALDEPGCVHTLTLLELSFFSLSLGPAFLQAAAPVFEAYNKGDHARALAMFLSAVSEADWQTCRTLLDDRVTGAIDQAIRDADTFFGIELPALAGWSFQASDAAAIGQPVLSVLGAESHPLWVEIAEFLKSNVPHLDECRLEEVGHLLHIQSPDPVANVIATFLAAHPMNLADRVIKSDVVHA